MGRVTIYLDDETEAKLVANARAMKLSKSKWIASVICEKLVDEWPMTVRALPGSWSDVASMETIRGIAQEGSEREPL